VESNWPLASQVEVKALPRPGFLLQQVHTLYRAQFLRWLAIMAPTSVLASLVILLSDQQVKAIFRSMPRGETRYHAGEVVQALALRSGGFFVSWLLGHQRAREHLGSIVLAAAFTFCVFLLGLTVAQFVEFAAFKLVGWSHFSRFIVPATLVLYVMVASIVSWLGATIPIILGGNTTVWAALKRSVDSSSGYEGALFLLVVESLVGSYLAWYATFHGLRMLVPDQLRDTSWYGWGVYLLAVLMTASVEPPLFIGFSLLADPEQLNPSLLPGS